MTECFAVALKNFDYALWTEKYQFWYLNIFERVNSFFAFLS